MLVRLLPRTAFYGTLAVGLAVLTWWLFFNPVAAFIESVPGMDNRPEGIEIGAVEVNIGALFEQYDGTASTLSADWPRFRGSDFDNISKETIPLADHWEGGGPTKLWEIELGEGHAGPVISEGRVYILDYDEDKRADVLRCFSLDDGKELWRRGYSIFIKRNHGMSRTVPAVSNGHVVTIGPMCQVMCVDAVTGDFKWGKDLAGEYGSEVPLWYTGQCPLIDGSTAVIAVGGRVLLTGLDLESGEVVWETPNPDNWKMSHSSIMPFTIHGQRMYVYCALGGIVGVSAEEGTTGEILFQTGLWNHNVVAPSPLYLGDGRLFVTAGYGAGSMMLSIQKDGETFTASALQTLKPEEGMASEQQTPLYYQGHLFSILPKDAGPLRNSFICCSPEDVGKILWSSDKTHRFGLGPYLVADGKFFILSDDGVLTIVKADTSGYKPFSETKILDGVDAWGPMVLTGGRLLARDSRRLVCLDVRKQQ